MQRPPRAGARQSGNERVGMDLSKGQWISPSDAMEAMTLPQDSMRAMVILVMALGLLVLLMDILTRSIRRSRRGSWQRMRSPSGALASAPNPGARPVRDRVDLAAEQMRAVAENGFERKPLLNRSEARLLPVLDGAAGAAGQGHRVMAQVALNEVIRPMRGAAEEALGAIVAKRLDFAIVDRRGMIACAVEYQGEGHWQNHAAMRDAVKREALRKAGVRVVEVHPGDSEEAVRASILALLSGPVEAERSGTCRR